MFSDFLKDINEGDRLSLGEEKQGDRVVKQGCCYFIEIFLRFFINGIVFYELLKRIFLVNDVIYLN